MALFLLRHPDMIAKIHSAGLYGIDAHHVMVEVDTSRGLPGWHMVGLPEVVVRESKDRVTAAIRNAGYQVTLHKTTINLAPARYKKSGTYFDLPIAIGLLEAARLIPAGATRRWLFVGELSLTGDLHPVPGLLSVALLARRRGYGLIFPSAGAAEVAIVRDLDWIAADRLADVVVFLCEGQRPPVPRTDPPAPLRVGDSDTWGTRGAAPEDYSVDLEEVKGQCIGRRALEIAAAGGHHLLFLGPPGTGKTMLAERLPTILPPLTDDEMVETTQIYSVMDELRGIGAVTARPFRAPHHSATAVGLVGGGPHPRAGEITLAHNGVLFLDELGEFPRDVIEVLRQPMESGTIAITRAAHHVRFPARFLLIAASNPCRCGYLGHPTIACICTMSHIQRYRAKLSGPLLDRIDLHVELGLMTAAELTQVTPGEASHAIRRRVLRARERQAVRYRAVSVCTNGQLGPKALREYCDPTPEGRALLVQAIERRGLSARAHDRILRVARTIADLAGDTTIAAPHIAEAIQYRTLDRPL